MQPRNSIFVGLQSGNPNPTDLAVQIGKLLPETLDSARLAPLTILGATVPQLQYVTELDNGMLIENMPNTNFSNNFFSLEVVSGPIIIVVGNAQLTSLDGTNPSHMLWNPLPPPPPY